MKLLHAKRLLLVRKRLLQIARSKTQSVKCKIPGNGEKPVGFHMQLWFAEDYTPHPCGTAACVLGHAALIPELRSAGLRLNIEGWDEITYRGHGNREAGRVFFGLSVEESRSLFIDNEAIWPSASDKAAEIAELVAKYHPELVSRVQKRQAKVKA